MLPEGVRAVVHRLSFITGRLYWTVNLLKFFELLSLRHLIMYFFQSASEPCEVFQEVLMGD